MFKAKNRNYDLIYRPKEDNFVAFKLEGKITKEDVDILIDEMHRKLKEFNNLRIYMEIDQFEGYTFRGFFEDLRNSFLYMTKLSKLALVTNEKWMQHLDWLGELFSSAHIKSFDVKDAETAIGWLRE